MCLLLYVHISASWGKIQGAQDSGVQRVGWALGQEVPTALNQVFQI